MAAPVRARRLTEGEGQRLLRIVRRGQETIRGRRALMIMAAARGTPVPQIAGWWPPLGTRGGWWFTRLNRAARPRCGPVACRAGQGSRGARRGHPDRRPATYHRTHGTRYFHGCYDLSQD